MFQKEYIFFLSLKGTRTMFAQSLKCSPSGPQCVLGMPALPGSSRLEQQLFCISLSVRFSSIWSFVSLSTVSLKPRVALNSCSSCLSRLCSGITDMCHHTWLIVLVLLAERIRCDHRRMGSSADNGEECVVG